MSMMYEAWQKPENALEVQFEAPLEEEMTFDDWVDVAISLTIAFLLAMIMILNYPQFKNKSEPFVVTEIKPLPQLIKEPPMEVVRVIDDAPLKPKPVVTIAKAEPIKPKPKPVVTVANDAPIKAKPKPVTTIALKPVIKSDVQPLEAINYKVNHILNGVFISDDQKVAMINNRFFNLGDMVDGLKITDIQHDNIKLENDKYSVMLRIVA